MVLFTEFLQIECFQILADHAPQRSQLGVIDAASLKQEAIPARLKLQLASGASSKRLQYRCRKRHLPFTRHFD
jgi:hypothetical protein